jgi:ABC-type transport system substrate-binding protein
MVRLAILWAFKGGTVMKQLVVGSLVLVLLTLGWGARSVGEEVPAPRGEVRIVDKNPLNWVSIVYNVFDHLVEIDKDGKLVPRLATAWQWLDDGTLEMTLRQGVKFHNGEVFDAEVVKLNWEENTRLRQPFRPGTFLNFKPGSTLEIRDPYTVRFVFPELDGGALAKISVLHIGNRQFYRDVGWGERSW